MADITHPSEQSGRALLARVAARARPLITTSEAATALGWDTTRAAKQLARWHKQGLVRRVKRGVYAIVPPSAFLQKSVVADPWVLVPAVFRHAYVGGWSAAEHWDLTEQVFTTLLVCTTDALKRTQTRVAEIEIRARHVPELQFFGTTIVWREGTRVLVSDIHKTLVDMFADPALGGGIQHVSQCFSAYLRREDANAERLLDYARRLGRAATFKRMGYITEALGGPQGLQDACAARVTLGLAKLDPAIKSPRVSKRWQLRLPKALDRMLASG
ncbi:MAG: type IV toxin-antitoxin system AbiEi family antitoxin domain-containing protein [Pseudomonadales bacterium]|nr:type IV toxin-antitoxin system AbiEi family antitoxin domain-containing protein [Pseudomonadales bacterium]